MGKQAAPEGYGFCPVCGGLFKLHKGDVPPHAWVGRGSTSCPSGEPVKEGEVSP